MKKYLGLLFILASTSTCTFAHPGTDWRDDDKAFETAFVETVAADALFQPTFSLPPISPQYLKQKLSEISGMVPVMINGMQVTISERDSNEGRNLAVQYLIQEYRALGFQARAESFANGINFVAEKVGKDPSKVLILSSHIDSVGNAGANDDASGTIVALAIANSLKGVQTKYTLRVVGFDREEDGLIGSRAYVQSIKDRSQIIGNIQVEMMGTNSRKDGRFHVIDCNRSESKFLTAKVMNAVGALSLPLTRVNACTERSDHASFWRANIPSIVLSENFFGGDSDPCYHASCDRVDSRIDYDYMKRIGTATAQAVADLLN